MNSLACNYMGIVEIIWFVVVRLCFKEEQSHSSSHIAVHGGIHELSHLLPRYHDVFSLVEGIRLCPEVGRLVALPRRRGGDGSKIHSLAEKNLGRRARAWLEDGRWSSRRAPRPPPTSFLTLSVSIDPRNISTMLAGAGRRRTPRRPGRRRKLGKWLKSLFKNF